jgi:hypothetical protein
MAKLKPCAHCGGKAREGHAEDGGIYLECDNPQCRMSTPLCYPIKESPLERLTEIWNRRP